MRATGARSSNPARILARRGRTAAEKRAKWVFNASKAHWRQARLLLPAAQGRHHPVRDGGMRALALWALVRCCMDGVLRDRVQAAYLGYQGYLPQAA